MALVSVCAFELGLEVLDGVLDRFGLGVSVGLDQDLVRARYRCSPWHPLMEGAGLRSLRARVTHARLGPRQRWQTADRYRHTWAPDSAELSICRQNSSSSALAMRARALRASSITLLWYVTKGCPGPSSDRAQLLPGAGEWVCVVGGGRGRWKGEGVVCVCVYARARASGGEHTVTVRCRVGDSARAREIK